jgi:serine/threonine-protein kinase
MPSPIGAAAADKPRILVGVCSRSDRKGASLEGTAHKRLGRYEIQEEIGRGMMGVVYRAFDPVLGRPVALKTVGLAFALPEKERRLFEDRFLAEARVSAGLAHPGIVVAHDAGRDAATGTLFIAFEHLEGRNLAELVAEGASMEWREALRIVGRVAEALQHAHGRGIIHRDIKPANVMILPGGEPKIMDFGIAKVPASQITLTGEFFGTPSYMSPEQARGDLVDARSDLFSLGSILYLLLTGRRAFDADTVPAILARVAHRDPPSPSRLLPSLTRDVDYLVHRALAKRRSDRYPDARTFAEDLADVREGRAPRHRGGWMPPARRDAALHAGTQPEPETVDLTVAGGLPVETSALPRPTGPGWLVLSLVSALGVLAALLRPSGPAPPISARPARPIPPMASPLPVPAPSPVPPPTTASAHLVLAVEHPFKWGTLRVWVDDQIRVEEPLESRPVKKLLLFKGRKGRETEVLAVTPGPHVIRVRVQGERFNASRTIRGTFKDGDTRSLEVRVRGKELALGWQS